VAVESVHAPTLSQQSDPRRAAHRHGIVLPTDMYMWAAQFRVWFRVCGQPHPVPTVNSSPAALPTDTEFLNGVFSV